MAADWGVKSSTGPGWLTVYYSKAFSGVPGVVAIQGVKNSNPKAQYLQAPALAAPRLAAPTVTAPSLAILTIQPPTPPQSWGDTAKQYVVSGCQSTIGQIPFVGGYLCSGIESTFGALAKIVFDKVQQVLYFFDIPALIDRVAAGTSAKIAADWNAAVAKDQAELNATFDEINAGLATVTADVNGALATITADAQTAVNSVYGFLNEAIGLFNGMAIPVAQIRNVSPVSFEIYSPGDSTPIYWLAIYA